MSKHPQRRRWQQEARRQPQRTLRGQAATSGAELNEKFRSEEGTFQLAFGSLETFYGGLEVMIGSPLMLDGSLEKSMEQEHTDRDDRLVEFTSSNGVTTTSAIEWEVANDPDPGQEYPDRKSFAANDPRRRKVEREPYTGEVIQLP